MAAHAALAPLEMSLLHILNSSQVSLVPPGQEIIKSACDEIKNLQNVIWIFEMSLRSSRCSKKAKSLDRKIRDAVCKVEDKLERHLSPQYLSQIDQDGGPMKFTIDLEEVRVEINSFRNVLMMIKWEYMENLKSDEDSSNSARNDLHKIDEETKLGDEGDDNIMEGDLKTEIESVEESETKPEMSEGYEQWEYLWNTFVRVQYQTKVGDEETVEYEEEDWQSTENYKMIGLDDQFIELKSLLIRGSSTLISIIGMAGIGKTAMANELYNDFLISKHFKCRAFIKNIGQEYKLKDVMIDILSQVDNRLDIVKMRSKSENYVVCYLQRTLVGERYLIVLDNVWSDQLSLDLYDILSASKGSRIVETTRIESLANSSRKRFRLRFLNKDESWSLLCKKVFGKDPCPYELVKVGKEIAENCEGLPLAIIAMAKLLSKTKKTLAKWKQISEEPNPLLIGTRNQEPMFDGLYSSFDRLSQLLKTCFLYMGVFPRKHEVRASKLIRLWMAEGFVTPHSLGSIECTSMEYLEELASQSIIVVTGPSSRTGIKTCKLHSVYWHMCVGEARRSKLFQVISRYSKKYLAENIKQHRRLCVHNNSLFGIKDANNKMLSLSNARSLLCTGPHHDYPIPMCFKTTLLRVLDVLTVRFYVFPHDIVKLVQLRYLAFTYDGVIHPSISQLWNLQFLIVKPHLHVVSLDPLYLPVEIWNMKELRHLQVTGALLPHPPDGAILLKLSTLLDINALSLTDEAIVQSIPNLNRLGIQIIGSWPDDLFCFARHLSHLNKLESLKCIVINPKPRDQVVAPPTLTKLFPPGLRKLTLSGFKYQWKCATELLKLKNLEVLKLRNYAFVGPEWEPEWKPDEPEWRPDHLKNTTLKGFLLEDLDSGRPDHLKNTTLKVLLLEDLDMVHCRDLFLSFPCMTHLTIKHCYKLDEIPFGLGSSSIKVIELVDVKPSVVASAKNELQQNKGAHEGIQLIVDCSWEDTKDPRAVAAKSPNLS